MTNNASDFSFFPKTKENCRGVPRVGSSAMPVYRCLWNLGDELLPVWWSLLNSNEYDRFCCLLLFVDAKIRKFRLQLLWHYNRQPLGMNETWHLEGLMSHSKKIHIVANSWVQDEQGMYPLFDWYLKLLPIGVCFFAASLHHTSKLFRRSQCGHEWLPNKHGIINITLHTPHHYWTIPVPIIQIRWHSCKTSLEALGGRTSTPLAQPIPSKHLPERLKSDFFKLPKADR